MSNLTFDVLHKIVIRKLNHKRVIIKKYFKCNVERNVKFEK